MKLKTPEDVRAALRSARLRRDMTLTEAADLAGVALRTLQNWEMGRTVPTLSGARRWAAAVGMVLTFNTVKVR